MSTQDTTILKFPVPNVASIDEVMYYGDLIQDEKTTMTRDAVEGLVPFMVGAVEKMHKEVVRLRSELSARAEKEMV